MSEEEAAAFVAKRNSICNSLTFLADECQDGDDPFFLMTAAMLLQVQSVLKLAEPATALAMLDAMIEVSKQRFSLGAIERRQ